MRGYQIALATIGMALFFAAAVAIQFKKCEYLGIESNVVCFTMVR
jgi:hypothetical protein